MHRPNRIYRSLGALALVAVLGWSYQPRVTDAQSKPRVAFLIGSMRNTRWLYDIKYLKQRLHQIDGSVAVDVLDANGDPYRQLGQADSELSKGVRVLLVAPVNPSIAAGVVTSAHKAHARVIAYDDPISSPGLDAYDGFDVVAIGRAEGNWLASHVRHGGTIAIINGVKGNPASRLLRTGYYDQVLAARFRRHDFKKIGDVWSKDGTALSAERALDPMLRHHRNLVGGVLAADDDLATGVVYSLERVGRQGRAKVTGEGATIDALRWVLQGFQGMTVYTSQKKEANAAADAADAFVRGKRLPGAYSKSISIQRHRIPATLFGATVITRSNVRVVLRDGTITKRQLCQGFPPKMCRGL